MPQFDLSNMLLGSIVGALIALALDWVKDRVKSLKERYISLDEGNSLRIHRVAGKVSVDEPRSGAFVGDRIAIKGSVAGPSGEPLSNSDILLLVRSRDSDEWHPRPRATIWPDVEGRWDADLFLPGMGTGEYEIVAIALPPDKARVIRQRPVVQLSGFPKEQDKLARLRVYHRPEASWPTTVSVAQRTDWLRPDVRLFLERSDLDLFAVDSAILTWVCPFFRDDWGWKDDYEILFNFHPVLVDRDLPADMMEVSRKFAAEHPKKLNSVRYCLTEFFCEPRDAGGRLVMTAQPVTYLTAYPIADVLLQSLKPGADRSLRDRWYSKLERRTSPLVPNMLIAHVLVVSGDDQLILMRRRADQELDYYRGHWSATFEEHFNAPWANYLQEQEVYPRSLVADETVFEGLRRALREEMSLSDREVSQTVLRVLAVGFEYDNFNTSIFAVAELPRYLTADKIRDRLKSSEEHDKLGRCPFDILTLRPTLIQSAPPQKFHEEGEGGRMEWRWHPTSRMRILLALRRRYGEVDLRRWLE